MSFRRLLVIWFLGMCLILYIALLAYRPRDTSCVRIGNALELGGDCGRLSRVCQPDDIYQ